jgi:hypothetical protein
MSQNTYKLEYGDHGISHWNESGYPADVWIHAGTLVNTEFDFTELFRGKFVRVPFDPDALDVDALYNPPPVIDNGGSGGEGSVNLVAGEGIAITNVNGATKIALSGVLTDAEMATIANEVFGG